MRKIRPIYKLKFFEWENEIKTIEERKDKGSETWKIEIIFYFHETVTHKSFYTKFIKNILYCFCREFKFR